MTLGKEPTEGASDCELLRKRNVGRDGGKSGLQLKGCIMK